MDKDKKLIEIIMGNELTREEKLAFGERIDEVFTEWYEKNEMFFDSYHDAQTYFWVVVI